MQQTGADTPARSRASKHDTRDDEKSGLVTTCRNRQAVRILRTGKAASSVQPHCVADEHHAGSSHLTFLLPVGNKVELHRRVETGLAGRTPADG